MKLKRSLATAVAAATIATGAAVPTASAAPLPPISPQVQQSVEQSGPNTWRFIVGTPDMMWPQNTWTAMLGRFLMVAGAVILPISLLVQIISGISEGTLSSDVQQSSENFSADLSSAIIEQAKAQN